MSGRVSGSGEWESAGERVKMRVRVCDGVDGER